MFHHPAPPRPTPLTSPALRRSRFLGLLGLAMVGRLIPGLPAAVVPGAEPKKWPPGTTKHTVVVTRKAADEAERRLIAAAEAAQPPRTEVQKAAGETKLPEQGPLWWYREALGLRVPYALTAEAVEYFTALVRGYGKELFTRYTQPSSRVDYTASVAAHESFQHGERTFTNVRVVTLTLAFDQNFCATGTEGLAFRKERVVVFDAAGAILAIIGDGPTETPILAI
jgi:hypothetical protein